MMDFEATEQFFMVIEDMTRAREGYMALIATLQSENDAARLRVGELEDALYQQSRQTDAALADKMNYERNNERKEEQFSKTIKAMKREKEAYMAHIVILQNENDAAGRRIIELNNTLQRQTQKTKDALEIAGNGGRNEEHKALIKTNEQLNALQAASNRLVTSLTKALHKGEDSSWDEMLLALGNLSAVLTKDS